MLPFKDNIRTGGVPVVTLLLIAVNVGIYAWAVDDALLPLIVNVAFLWIFGNSLEEGMGPVAFLFLYVVAGLLTTGVLLAAGIDLSPLVAATGASAGVLGGYLVRYPQGEVLCAVVLPFAFTIVAVPALAFLGVWAALQALIAGFDLNGAINPDDVIAYIAPVAGLVLGAATVKLFATRLNSQMLLGP